MGGFVRATGVGHCQRWAASVLWQWCCDGHLLGPDQPCRHCRGLRYGWHGLFQHPQHHVTRVRKSVVVPTARTFHVSATQIVAAMATVARTMRRVAVNQKHALKSVVVPTTTRTVGASATTFVKQKATAARTTKKVVVEAKKQHLCEHCHRPRVFLCNAKDIVTCLRLSLSLFVGVDPHPTSEVC